MTADLAAFVLALLDEEAETARVARRHWSMRQGEQNHPLYFEGRGDREAHIARQDPQATLDRVEATRAVVAMHERHDPYPPGTPPVCVDCSGDVEDEPWPCPTLRALASAYRRHPDYDQAWLPDGVGVDA